MAGLRLITAFLTLGVISPALAGTCVIVYATDRPYWQEIRAHEIDHCKGWTHPETAAPRKGENYQAFKAPLWIRLKPYRGDLIEHPVSTHDAKKLCDGHWGCQHFE